MKSFLLNSDNKPIIQWGLLKNNTFYEGEVPKNYSLAVCPSENIVILDVDMKNGKDGYSNIPRLIQIQLDKTFNYKTKSGGAHYFIRYTGNKILKNCATEFGLDLRIGAKKNNCGGYVRWYGNIHPKECIPLIKPSSTQLNKFLEKLFT